MTQNTTTDGGRDVKHPPTDWPGHELAVTYEANRGERTVTGEIVEVREYGTDGYLVRIAEPDARRSRFINYVTSGSVPSGLLKSENSKAKGRGRKLGWVRSVEDLGEAENPIADAFAAVKRAAYGDVVSFDGRELVRGYTHAGRTFVDPENGDRFSVGLYPGGVRVSPIGVDRYDAPGTVDVAEWKGQHPDAADDDAMAEVLADLERHDEITVNGTGYVITGFVYDGETKVGNRRNAKLVEQPHDPEADGYTSADAHLSRSWSGLVLIESEGLGEYTTEPAVIGGEAATDGGEPDLNAYCADCGTKLVGYNGDWGTCNNCDEYKKTEDIELRPA